MSLPILCRNFQNRTHRAPQECQSTCSSTPGGGYSSPEDEIDVEEIEEIEAVNTFINAFRTQKARRIEQATISSMSLGLILRRKYFVSEIREVEGLFGRQQVWTLVDIDDNSSRKIWAPPSLAETVTERDDNGVLYFSQKKRDIVLKSVTLHYLGYTGRVTAPTAYNFDFYEKLSK